MTFNNNASLFEQVTVSAGLNNWGSQNYSFTARRTGTLIINGNNNATGNIVEKANSIPYYHADYETALEMTRRMYENHNFVDSGLVTGTRLGCNDEIYAR